jgi:hypothetical protein
LAGKAPPSVVSAYSLQHAFRILARDRNSKLDDALITFLKATALKFKPTNMQARLEVIPSVASRSGVLKS